jgi:hypothetical protein
MDDITVTSSGAPRGDLVAVALPQIADAGLGLVKVAGRPMPVVFAVVVMPPPAASATTPIHRAAESLRAEFESLAECWRREATHFSLEWQQAMHPAYQRIIGMGDGAIPLILDDLKRTRSRWFWALRALNKGVDVAANVTSHGEKVAAWLAWGASRGLVGNV